MSEAAPNIPPPDVSPNPSAPTSSMGPAHDRTWFMVVGGLLIVTGIAALVFPVVSTLATTVLVGWLLMIGGIAQIVHAFRARRWKGSIWYGLTGLAWLVGGIVAVFYPVVGTVGFTLALAAVLIVQGVFALAGLGFTRSDSPAWRVVNGVFAILGGVLIWVWLPGSALWVLGVVAGINFLITGVTYFTIGAALASRPAT